MEPMAIMGLHAAYREMRSALPDAPVVEDRPRRQNRYAVTVRLATAGVLRRTADRLEARVARARYG